MMKPSRITAFSHLSSGSLVRRLPLDPQKLSSCGTGLPTVEKHLPKDAGQLLYGNMCPCCAQSLQSLSQSFVIDLVNPW